MNDKENVDPTVPTVSSTPLRVQSQLKNETPMISKATPMKPILQNTHKLQSTQNSPLNVQTPTTYSLAKETPINHSRINDTAQLSSLRSKKSRETLESISSFLIEKNIPRSSRHTKELEDFRVAMESKILKLRRTSAEGAIDKVCWDELDNAFGAILSEYSERHTELQNKLERLQGLRMAWLNVMFRADTERSRDRLQHAREWIAAHQQVSNACRADWAESAAEIRAQISRRAT